MPSLDQARAARRGRPRASPTLPIVVSLTFNEEGTTFYGDKPEDVVRTLEELGRRGRGRQLQPGPAADAGDRAAHGRGGDARQALGHAQRRRPRPGGRPLRLPLHARVHGVVRAALHRGRGDLRGRLLRHDARPHPQPRALGAHAAAGARGGDGASPPAVAKEAPAPDRRARRRARSARKLGKKFVVSVELDPPKGADPGRIIDRAQYCKENEVDAINVADGPRASARMSAQSLCVLHAEQGGDRHHPPLHLPRPEPARHPVRPAGRVRARACATSWPSPAIRPSSATIRTRPRSTTWTPSGSSAS